jgi:hypothetical protein
LSLPGKEELDLIMIIVEGPSPILYSGIKYFGDIKFKIPTQVLLQKNVEKCDRNTVRY